MREIKFRAWDKEMKIMQYDIGKCYIRQLSDDWGMTIWMQYTGLKDKNGKEIYEGDIVEASISSEWDEEVPRNERAVVVFEEDRYWCKSQYTPDWYEMDAFSWEVIGNIYENPELLED